MPRINHFWAKAYTISTGIIATTAAAIRRFQRTLYCPWNEFNPTGTVRISSELVTTNGHRKSFHVLRKIKILTAAIAVLLIGMMMFHQMRSDEAPSMRAASSRSIGRVKKCWRNKKVLNAENAGGTIKAQYVLYQSRLMTMMKLGLMLSLMV